ncbi:hypothetical protein MRX96_018879 [Rhipicephalus microplus]
MAPAWQEVDHARTEKRCELVLSGAEVSKRIEEDSFDVSVYTLFHLNFLEVSHTCLPEIPVGIARLVNLTRLVLNANQLSKLPPDLGKLRKLKFLDSFNVSNNRLTAFPDEFSKLTRLIVFNFSRNKLEEFPSFLAGETRFPGEIGDISKLKELLLKDNPLSDKRLKKLVEQCHYKQVLEYVKGHGPRDSKGTAQDKSGASKKGKKKGASAPVDIQEVQNAFEVLQLSSQSPVVIVSDAVQEVRPYIVCCIIRNVYLDRDNRLRKFLTLQNKLHDTICVKRSEATIATHDLAKITGNVYYDAIEPDKLKLTPLGRKQEVSGKELYRQMTEEADAMRKEKKRSTYPGIYKYLYLLKDKTLYPFLRDESKLVISFPPMTNSDGTRISEETRNVFAEVTGNNLPFCKKVMDALLAESLQLGLGNEEALSEAGSTGDGGATTHRLQVEKVKVVDKDGNLRVVYPSKTDLVCPGVVVEQRSE